MNSARSHIDVRENSDERIGCGERFDYWRKLFLKLTSCGGREAGLTRRSEIQTHFRAEIVGESESASKSM